MRGEEGRRGAVRNVSLVEALVEYFLGRKYYANTIFTRGQGWRREIASFVFRTKEEARAHRDRLETNGTYGYIETVSFRSREEY